MPAATASRAAGQRASPHPSRAPRDPPRAASGAGAADPLTAPSGMIRRFRASFLAAGFDQLQAEVFDIKRTYQPKKRYRRRVHGFLRRMDSVGGARVIQNRRRKGRSKLTPG